MELHRNSMYKHNQLKQFVYALFTQKQVYETASFPSGVMLSTLFAFYKPYCCRK